MFGLSEYLQPNVITIYIGNIPTNKSNLNVLRFQVVELAQHTQSSGFNSQTLHKVGMCLSPHLGDEGRRMKSLRSSLPAYCVQSQAGLHGTPSQNLHLDYYDIRMIKQSSQMYSENEVSLTSGPQFPFPRYPSRVWFCINNVHAVVESVRLACSDGTAGRQES